MDSQQVFTLGQSGLYMLLMISAPMLLTVLAVGLLVSIFQAATQIHEATLSFVPKLIAAVAVLAVAGPWMLTTLVEYVQRTLQAIPGSWDPARRSVRMGGSCCAPVRWRASIPTSLSRATTTSRSRAS